jgi:hypothetical protein
VLTEKAAGGLQTTAALLVISMMKSTPITFPVAVDDASTCAGGRNIHNQK